MKTIGLLGGMSWESTQTYYSLTNKQVTARLVGLHSAKILLLSLDFAKIEKLQTAGDWSSAATILSDAAKQLEAGGADCFATCSNTMHAVFDEVRSGVQIPCLHIADALGEFAAQNSLQTLGLLGTRFTMERDFFRGRLSDNYGIAVSIPNELQRRKIHRIIYEELCLGEVKDTSRDYFLGVIRGLTEMNIDGVVLGCTEIGLLLQQTHVQVPVLDTTSIHVQSLVEFAMDR
ncbi:MAG: aspartate/glutamate racemase family protein [Betaproteobacteria bacterium]